jgi:dihydroxyacetone kinase
MKRMLNEPTSFKDEMIDGFIAAYGRYVRRVPNASGIMAFGAPVKGKVSLLIGGGSGHYPAFCGLVGSGLADGAAIGDIFTSPSGEQVYRCTHALDGGAGVLYSYGNYSGDIMHFGMAEMRCRGEGMDVRTVLVTDDVASAPRGKEEERRGIAGDFYVFKVAGARRPGETTSTESRQLLTGPTMLRALSVLPSLDVRYQVSQLHCSRWIPTAWRSGLGYTASQGSAPPSCFPLGRSRDC